MFLYPRAILADQSPGAVRCWSVLSAARSGHRITRTGERSLVIDALDHPLLDGSFDTLYRGDDRLLVVGDTIEQCGATIRLAALRDGRPARLDVTLRRSLDDPSSAGWYGAPTGWIASPCRASATPSSCRGPPVRAGSCDRSDHAVHLYPGCRARAVAPQVALTQEADGSVYVQNAQAGELVVLSPAG